MNPEIDDVIKTNDGKKIYELGLKYYYGEENTQRNYNASIILFQKALELGEQRAKLYIAESNYFGKGIEKNRKRAFEIFSEIVEETNAMEARFYIGAMYYWGHYVKKDYEKAYKIFSELVEEYDDKDSKEYIGEMYYYGKYIEQDYKKAFEIFSEVEDNKYAKSYIGEMYYYGDYVKQDFERAYNIFKELEDKLRDGYPEYMLGQMWENGYFVKIDENKAKEFYEKSSKKNNEIARERLVYVYYYFGDFAKALEMFKKTKKYGVNGETYYLAGYIYLKNNNKEKAIECLEKSSELGFKRSEIMLKDMQNMVETRENDENKEKYLHEKEKTLCDAIIYFVLATSKSSEETIDEQNVKENMIRVLNYNRETLEAYAKDFPQDHPFVTEFKKTNDLNDETYLDITNKLRQKIRKFKNQEKKYNLLYGISNAEMLDTFSRILISSSDYNSVDEYIEEMLNKNDEKIVSFMNELQKEMN